MKLQEMTIVFLLIIIPLFFVLSATISYEETLFKTQQKYDQSIYSASQGAMRAFEMNTANEKFSKVSDVLRTIVEASLNVYKDNLATNLGMSNVSKQYIDEYFPLGLFTLYDGYYISSPVKEPIVARNKKGNAVHVDDVGVKKVQGDDVEYDENAEDENPNANISTKYSEKNDHKPVIYLKEGGGYTINPQKAVSKSNNVLRNYIPYTATYMRNPNEGVTINYTFDNYISIRGKKDKYTYSKSGYLLPKDFKLNFVEEKDADQDSKKIIEPTRLIKYDILSNNKIDVNNDEIDRIVDLAVDIARENYKKDPKSKYTKIQIQISATPDKNSKKLEYGKYENIQIVYDAKDDMPKDKEPKKENFANSYDAYVVAKNEYDARRKYSIQQINAIKYYIKAEIFSRWIYKNLDWIKVKDATIDSPFNLQNLYKSESDQNAVFINFKDIADSNEKIFDENTLSKNSVFNFHKIDVMRQNIQYNLILSAYHYNLMRYNGAPNYDLPLIRPDDWEKIIGKISFTTFMEGFKLGNRVYNNYQTISSSMNEFTIIKENMVFVEKDLFNRGDKDKKAYYYSLSSNKKFYDSINPEDQRQDLKYVGDLITRFKYDAHFDKKSSKDYYDHKNYADFESVIISDQKEEKVNNLKKRLYLTSIAAAREKIYKLCEAINDSTYEIKSGKNIESSNDFNLVSDVLGIDNQSSSLKKLNLTFSLINRLEKDNNMSDEEFQNLKKRVLNRKKYAMLTLNIRNKNNDPNQNIKCTYKIAVTNDDTNQVISFVNGRDSVNSIFIHNPIVDIESIKIYDSISNKEMDLKNYIFRMKNIRLESY